jgi:hypothetical protein
LLVGEDGDDGLLGDVLRFWFVWPVVPPAPDEPLELPVAPVPPLPALSAGRSQPARSAPESAPPRRLFCGARKLRRRDGEAALGKNYCTMC